MLKQLHRAYKRHGSSMSNPANFVLAVYHLGRWKNTLPKPFRQVVHRAYRLSFLATNYIGGNHLPAEVSTGEDLHLMHAKDVCIHPQVKLGDRVGIMHEVTIASTVDRPGVPEIGDDVFIGAGAKIIGPVKIGDGARIAPNSLVVTNVPAGATAIGVPARIVRKPKQSEETANRAKAARMAQRGGKASNDDS